MERQNQEGAIYLNRYSVEIKRLLDQAASDREATQQQVIQETARILGVQAAQQAKTPEDVPILIKSIVEQAAQGITAGMMIYHGKHGVLDVHMVQLTR